MLSLSQFPDFVASTREYIEPSMEVLNETSKQGYEILELINGQEERRVIQSGKSIDAFIRLKKHQAAQFYRLER